MSSDLIIIAFVLLVLEVVYGRFLRRKSSQNYPEFTIVVDGSNVMHWGGDASADVLRRVLRSLENKGHTPVVFFDASVGYRLGDRYFGAAKLASLTGIPTEHICVVDKGAVADQAILMFATDRNLRVVTNDQFRDWRVQFPHAAKKGKLVRGTWRDGAAAWRGKL